MKRDRPPRHSARGSDRPPPRFRSVRGGEGTPRSIGRSGEISGHGKTGRKVQRVVRISVANEGENFAPVGPLIIRRALVLGAAECRLPLDCRVAGTVERRSRGKWLQTAPQEPQVRDFVLETAVSGQPADF